MLPLLVPINMRGLVVEIECGASGQKKTRKAELFLCITSQVHNRNGGNTRESSPE